MLAATLLPWSTVTFTSRRRLSATLVSWGTAGCPGSSWEGKTGPGDETLSARSAEATPARTPASSQGQCVLINDRLRPLPGASGAAVPLFPLLPRPGASEQVKAKAGSAVHGRARADRWENHQPRRVMIN